MRKGFYFFNIIIAALLVMATENARADGTPVYSTGGRVFLSDLTDIENEMRELDASYDAIQKNTKNLYRCTIGKLTKLEWTQKCLIAAGTVRDQATILVPRVDEIKRRLAVLWGADQSETLKPVTEKIDKIRAGLLKESTSANALVNRFHEALAGFVVASVGRKSRQSYFATQRNYFCSTFASKFALALAQAEVNFRRGAGLADLYVSNLALASANVLKIEAQEAGPVCGTKFESQSREAFKLETEMKGYLSASVAWKFEKTMCASLSHKAPAELASACDHAIDNPSLLYSLHVIKRGQ